MTHKIVKIFAISLALIFIAVALTASMPQNTAQANPQVLAQAVANPISTGQPVMSENTNITWSSFNQTMAPNEYLNGTGNPDYINAEPSTFYQNYISVNPADIIDKGILQSDRLGNSNIYWGNTSEWQMGNTPTNIAESLTGVNNSGISTIKETVNVLDATHGSGLVYFKTYVASTNYSSQGIEYDYLTSILTLTAVQDSGAIASMHIWNSTGYGTELIGGGSGTYYTTESLQQIEKADGYSTNFNTTAGNGYSSYIEMCPAIAIPSGAPVGTYTLTVNALSMTTYPVTFGSNSTGSTITSTAGNLQLSDFHPDINNVSVVNDGYSEALSMPAQMSGNYTQTQNQITGSDYIEETTAQGNLVYPTGTDVSYSGTNITMQMNGIEGKQVPLLNVNGVSFSDRVSNASGNATINLGSTNPNQPVNVIYQVEYTAAQWNSFTAPPFFLSVQGIEYYWWVGLIAIFGGLGVFAGFRSYATGKEEDLRAPPRVR